MNSIKKFFMKEVPRSDDSDISTGEARHVISWVKLGFSALATAVFAGLVTWFSWVSQAAMANDALKETIIGVEKKIDKHIDVDKERHDNEKKDLREDTKQIQTDINDIKKEQTQMFKDLSKQQTDIYKLLLQIKSNNSSP